MGHLRHLFEPESIALIGVSRDANKLSHGLMRNVVEAGTRARVYPISHGPGQILGCQSYPNLRALPESPDLVLVSVGSERVAEAIREAAAVKAGVAVILSSGFGETSEKRGKVLEEELLSIARGSGLRIMGPNCLGVYNGHENLNGTYLVRPPLEEGNISVASQSGAYGGILVHELNARGIGLGKFASIGNQVDISHADCIEHFADDDRTEVIGLFVEGVRDGPGFLTAIRRVSTRKPVVVFKAGRTSTGRRAAASHTGSMAGDFQVFQAAVRQAGAIVAHTTDEFHDFLCVFSCCCHRLPREGSLAILTISGGPSVAAGDYCEELGLVVPPLSGEIRDAVRPYLPPFAAVSNPVDMTVATPPENFGPIADAVMAEPTISGAVALNWGWDRPEFAQAFVDASAKHEKPVLACAVENPIVQGVFRKNRLPNLTSPERAVKSYWALVQQRKNRARAEVVRSGKENR